MFIVMLNAEKRIINKKLCLIINLLFLFLLNIGSNKQRVFTFSFHFLFSFTILNKLNNLNFMFKRI